MRSSLTSFLVSLTALLLLGGCAAHRGGAASALAMPPLEDYIAGLRQASVMARPSTSKTVLATAETSDPALAVALAAVQVFPSADAHLQAAAAYRRLGITDKAHEHFTYAANADSRNAAAYDGLARVWRDWGFPNKALPHAHRAVYFAPGSPSAHNTLGTVFQGLGRYSDARQEYEAALSLDPRAAYALNNICAIELLEGRPEAAGAACRRALAVDPGLLVAQQNLQRASALAALANSGDEHARH